MVLKQDGSVWATGDNGLLWDRYTFTEVIPSKAIAVASGNYHTMALKSDGSVWARAWNKEEEQLGDGAANCRGQCFMRVTGMSSGVSWTLSACTMHTPLVSLSRSHICE